MTSPIAITVYITNSYPVFGRAFMRDEVVTVDWEDAVGGSVIGAGDYTVDHTAYIYLMDRDGHFVAPFNLKRTPEEAAVDLKRYL